MKYKALNDRIIQRSDGATYQKGKIVIMLKKEIIINSNLKFNLNGLDNILNDQKVSSISKRFPLTEAAFIKHPESTNLKRIFTIIYESDLDPTELSGMLAENNKDIVEWAEPDFVYKMDYLPNDPSIGAQYHISRINCYQAWDLSKGDTSVVIGIVDSGSDLDHPDLAANIKFNYADPVNGIDDDGNGYIDDFKGWDFFYSDNDPNINGGNDHGSAVSGDASQVADNGVHGAGPGFKVKLRISKHAPDYPDNGIYGGYDGITYMYMNGVKIINCSWGGGFSSFGQTIVTNAWNAGSIVIAAAGNQSSNTTHYPASFDNVVSVAATNSTDIKADFSNWNSTVDVSAPGDQILSTVYNNAYIAYSGTSMSTPITSGTVGLIKSKYPTWTAQEVVNRLILGVDSIYNLNPGYIGGLGSGRINAFKCLADKPILAVLSFSHNDSLYGNNDKVYEAGEKIPIIITYKNKWLTGNNISLRISSNDTNITFVKDSVFAGTLNQFTTYNTTPANTFEVMAKPGCPFDKMVTFRLKVSGTYFVDTTSISMPITFRQGWVTHNINNLKLSLTKDGAIGKKVEPYGSGLFLNPPYPQVNNLNEGSLLIGVSSTKVSDAARKGPPAPYNKSDTDFTALQSYTMTTPGIYANQEGNGLFNDDGAGSNKIGVTVRSSSFAWNTATDLDYIILRYVIRNTSGANITNMYVGMNSIFYPRALLSNNMTAVDSINKIGYTYNNDSTNPYLGIALLSGQTLGFRAINNGDILNGFTSQEKWDALSLGISTPALGPGSNSFVISCGPINLNNNDSTVVGFAIVKGINLADLIANALKAKLKYLPIGINPISGNVPEKYELYQNYPNPFNPRTMIRFAIPKTDNVSIKIFDILGRENTLISSQKLEAGTYELPFDGSDIASGVYFYRIETSGFTDVKKMILVK